MNTTPWDASAPLDEPATWLLEASAGTGKTFQIAGLFARLIAERGVPVDRILAITFTKAATGELKERIRARLRSIRTALADASSKGSPDPASRDEDPTLAHLRRLPDRDRMLLRLELAIRDFDQAAISTMHSFSQRTLRELAFEAGQEPDLELLTSSAALQEELVDDALARVFAATTAAQIALYQQAQFHRAALLAVVRNLSGATRLRIQPEDAPQDPLDLLPLLAEREQRFAELAAFWQADAGEAARAALLEEQGYFSKTKNLGKALLATEDWLRNSRTRLDLPEDLPTLAWLEKATLKENKGQERPWSAFFRDFDAHVARELAFLRRFRPLASFAHGVRDAFEARLAAAGKLTFDGMLSHLADAVTTPGEAGDTLAARLAERYDAVFVDEFQDTDLSQWTVLRRAFHGRRHLFLIGDPKQAIYAFRGADVDVYLDAKRTVSSAGDDAAARESGGPRGFVRTMTENHRSDAAAVDAMNALWRDQDGPRATFDYPGEAMDYVRITAAHDTRLGPERVGLSLRWLDGRLVGEAPGKACLKTPRRLIGRLAAEEARAWLRGERGARRGETGEPSKFLRSELAVLVSSHEEARVVRDALARLGIPAVIAAKRSVFETPAARWLEAWLDAVQSGGRDREARRAAVTPIVGWTADELAWSLAIAEREDAVAEAEAAGRILPAQDAPLAMRRDWNEWTARLRQASERWSRGGFARTLDRELTELDTLPRVLALPEGERHATDLRHLFELLHVEERTRRHGPGTLADWLRAEAKADADERELRLESDADAVRVETVHVSKGLEYPVVLLPFAWKSPLTHKSNDGIVLRVDDEKTLDLRSAHDPLRAAALIAEEETRDREALRLLYVSLTRAKHRTVAWWGPVGKGNGQMNAIALARLALREPGQTFATSTYPSFTTTPEKRKRKDACAPKPSGPKPKKSGGITAIDLVRSRVAALCARSDGTIESSEVERPDRSRAMDTMQEHAEITVAPWPSGRDVPTFSGRWGVTSYSGLARGAAATDRDEKHRTDEVATTTTDGHPGDDAAPVATTAAPVQGASPAPERVDVVENDGEGAAAEVVRPPLVAFLEPGRLTAGRGTVFGTFVHEVFEHLDFQASLEKREPTSEARRDFERLVVDTGARHGFGATSREVTDVLARMPALLTTPLGSTHPDSRLTRLPADTTLARIAQRGAKGGPGDRLDELAFDLRLGDGSRYVRPRRATRPDDEPPLTARPGCVDPARVYEALAKERGVPGLEAWLAHQERRKDDGRALVGSIAGILTGSIDLVFRVTQASGEHAYFLADYKTNTIEGSQPGHYAGPWLDWKMATSGYVLQSLLYSLALHRHLALRLGAQGQYEYEKHFGGVLYLFVRGMGGVDTPRCPQSGHCLGVHGHRWSWEVIEALDQALAPLLANDPVARTTAEVAQ